ncbi:tyrosine-type recombinase/integrase [Brevibacillus brevis]|uniref:tyrosine-type recombinase/integrase n=1 Tax=Brevibacillus brevis TaxID=1393 RepID=UPI0007D8B880|nr:tyrosine-type recombinase/integrase [Brevibacillus brevis]
MNTAVNNIVGFNNRSVYSTITSFLEYKGDRSDDTQKAYKKDIKIFFMYTRNKNIDQLEVIDLEFTIEDVIKYRNYLGGLKKADGERKYVNKSINRMIDSLRSLYSYLERAKYDVDKSAFALDDLPEHDSKEIGYLTLEEIEQMIEHAKSLPNGTEKYIFWELGWKTSIRINALLSITWEDFRKVNDDIVIVRAIEKGNEIREMPITNEFYQRILEIRGNAKPTDRVFKFGSTTVFNTMEILKERIGISEDREVSFHSVRKFLIDLMVDLGDLKAAMAQSGHKSIETLWKHYANKQKDYESMAGVMIERTLNEAALDEMSKEELLAIIKADGQIKNRVLMKLARGKRG